MTPKVPLTIRDLVVTLPADETGRRQQLVRGVSFDVKSGRIVGLVGESGSGKSTIADAVMRLNPEGFGLSGEVLFDGRNLLACSEGQMRRVRGRRVALVGQDPLESLNPTHRIGQQVAEAILVHSAVGKRAARQRSLEVMRQCGLANADHIYTLYPDQLSGGMRQRVAIAMALAADPDTIIADEPTTSLDNTVQAQILQLLARLCRDTGVAIILITHDLGIVQEISDDLVVLYAGNIVEQGPTTKVLRAPRHPYTRELLRARPVVAETPIRHLHVIPGVAPKPSQVSSGCAFAPRCAFKLSKCEDFPQLAARGLERDHLDRCWRSVAVSISASAQVGEL